MLLKFNEIKKQMVIIEKENILQNVPNASDKSFITEGGGRNLRLTIRFLA